MDVRLARPTDVPLVLRLALDQRAHLVRSFGWPSTNPVMETLMAAVAPLAARSRVWVARDGGSRALVEATPRRYVIGWDVTRLSVHGDHDAVVGPVLRSATDYLQDRSVPRIFARCGESASEELKEYAFHPLAREYVLLGPQQPPHQDSPLPLDSRYRMPQDAWPLHQLESSATPTLVRQMEGLTSLDWSKRIPNMREIVVERDGRVVAWIGWGAKLSRGVSQIGLIVHPDYPDLASTLLRHALAANTGGTRFVARVRDYHSEILSAFLDAGFAMAAEEILMVRHARVVLAPLLKTRISVAQVPGVQALRHHLNMQARRTRTGADTRSGGATL